MQHPGHPQHQARPSQGLSHLNVSHAVSSHQNRQQSASPHPGRPQTGSPHPSQAHPQQLPNRQHTGSPHLSQPQHLSSPRTVQQHQAQQRPSSPRLVPTHPQQPSESPRLVQTNPQLPLSSPRLPQAHAQPTNSNQSPQAALPPVLSLPVMKLEPKPAHDTVPDKHEAGEERNTNGENMDIT